MQQLGYQFSLPLLLSVLFLLFLLLFRQKLFKQNKPNWLWTSITIFVMSYFLIMAFVSYIDIAAGIHLQTFDVDNNGSFDKYERTPAQQLAMKEVIGDNARNFAFITGLIYAGVFTFILMGIAKLMSLTRNYFNVIKSRMST